MRTLKEALQKLRGSIAFSKQCEPFKVFRNTELDLLLKVKPTTIEGLSTIKGFPPTGNRVLKWGEAIIKIFQNVDSIEDFKTEGKPGEDPTVKVILKKSNAFG